jgi:Response regulator containing CheY-like receiver, AAA-type ATPase, and DNA-binding domains
MSKPITVLHIDGDQDFLGVSTSILALFGDFTVDFAQTTKQAEQQLKKKNYDVIISAFYLSDVNGLEFLKKLRQTGVKSRLVLFTVNAELAELASKEGIQFIGKYGEPDEVFAKLCQIMKSSTDKSAD